MPGLLFKALWTLIALFLVLWFFFAMPVQAKHLNPEKYYQAEWCEEMKGQTEVILDDKTRVDCITETNAVEVDFAPKWAEAIGQALYYSAKTGKKAGILIIMENPAKDAKYVNRILKVINHYHLKMNVYLIFPEGK